MCFWSMSLKWAYLFDGGALANLMVKCRLYFAIAEIQGVRGSSFHLT